MSVEFPVATRDGDPRPCAARMVAKADGSFLRVDVVVRRGVVPSGPVVASGSRAGRVPFVEAPFRRRVRMGIDT